MSTVNSVISWVQPGCPIRGNYHQYISVLLHDRVFGQDEATDQIINKIVSHNGQKPLVFHFAGDNGTGKTLIAKLFGQGKFTEMDDQSEMPSGVLYIRGTNFLYDETGIIRKTAPERYFTKIEEMKSNLRNDLVKQLTKCPESLIIFDEYTIPNRRILATLENFLDEYPIKTDDNTFITAKYATFIFISDFGAEDISYHHTNEEMLNLIAEDMARCWGDNLLKLQHLQDSVIAFRRLPIPSPDVIDTMSINDVQVPHSVVLMVSRLLQELDYNNLLQSWAKQNHLGFVNWVCDNSCKQQIARIIYYTMIRNKIYRYRNYRGIEQLFGELVIGKTVREILKIKNPPKNFTVMLKPSLQSVKINIEYGK